MPAAPQRPYSCQVARNATPAWDNALRDKHFTADLSTPAAARKAALLQHGNVVARLSRQGWVLLHSCLVRFLCRDDGRFD